MAASRLDHYPTGTELHLRYNAPSEDGLQVWEDLYGETLDEDPHVYVSTFDEPAPITEWESVLESIDNCVLDFLKDIDHPEADDFGRTIYDAGDAKYSGYVMGMPGPYDRTVEVPANVVLFCPTLVRMIQDELAEWWPLWRVQLLGDLASDDLLVTIYPDAVVAGGIQSPPADFDETIDRFRDRELEHDDQSEGVQRRQLEHIKPLIAKHVETIEREKVMVLSVFDRNEEDVNEFTVWLLQEINSPTAYMESLDAADSEGPAIGESLGVTGQGEVVDEMDSTAKYRAVELVIAKDEAQRLIVSEAVHDKENWVLLAKPGGQVWTFELREYPVISDDELKAKG